MFLRVQFRGLEQSTPICCFFLGNCYLGKENDKFQLMHYLMTFCHQVMLRVFITTPFSASPPFGSRMALCSCVLKTFLFYFVLINEVQLNPYLKYFLRGRKPIQLLLRQSYQATVDNNTPSARHDSLYQCITKFETCSFRICEWIKDDDKKRMHNSQVLFKMKQSA